MISNGTVAAGGETDADELYIAPTVLVDVPLDSQIMQEEVFGPILPVLEIDSVEKVIDWVNERPAPLGLYVFSEDESVVDEHPRADELRGRVRQRLRPPPAGAAAAVRRRRQLGHGQVPRPLGIRGVHKRARGPVPQRSDRPRRQVPAVQRAQARAQDHEQVDVTDTGLR